jgi:hypothetical protein
LPREKVPGGWVGLTVVTLAPLAIIVLAIYSQIVEEGLFNAIGLGLLAILVGAVLYFPMRRLVKPGVPDVDPYRVEAEAA